ncbi:TetR/AcrR family transcriptional regulator [Nocardia jiangxiensis]|uniref:TetR/AcrR family transcriptional regulator n=1 Tax=Nocardia jiangxiensis TaxID=282685 RepID=A0ABW6S9X1_9NOCA|nr:TetR/AcrR family transcriptional regulator [Nocardia jiangxiensis]
MPTRTPRSSRRTEALSRERIVAAAIDLLDIAGETGLTFRALTERLATGPGAIYWHVANKGELLAAATDAVVTAALTREPAEPAATPRERIRAVALGLFDAIDEHAWLATQLAIQMSRDPAGTLAPRLFEGLGRQISALDVPEAAWFTATSALMNYILGAAGQNATNGRNATHQDRPDFLDTVATTWENLDPEEYPFTRAVARQLRGHDDREQFLDGLDLVLSGITAVHSSDR